MRNSLLTLFVASSSLAASAPLPFVEDDCEHARAEAVARHLPLFVDVWAPW